MKIKVFLPALAGVVIGAFPVQAEMQGDAEAIELATTMMEHMGNVEAWATAKTFYAVEKTRSLNGDGIVGTFWRPLDEAKEWYQLNSRTGNIVRFWWDDRGVYQTVNGNVTSENLPEDIMNLVHDYWPGEIYIMYHRFAKQDETLRLEKHEDNSFTAYDLSRDERRLGTFWVNGEGHLYRWRHDDGTEYIYGPHKKFGDLSMPTWGTQIDGSWSFEYVEVRLLDSPPPVSFDSPE